jgi:hypothetical protein
MHHKRHRAKHRRSGCLLCKPYKRGGQAKTFRVKGLRAPRRWMDVPTD